PPVHSRAGALARLQARRLLPVEGLLSPPRERPVGGQALRGGEALRRGGARRLPRDRPLPRGAPLLGDRPRGDLRPHAERPRAGGRRPRVLSSSSGSLPAIGRGSVSSEESPGHVSKASKKRCAIQRRGLACAIEAAHSASSTSRPITTSSPSAP